MSNFKRGLIISGIVLLVITLGNITLTVPGEETNFAPVNAEYRSQYLFGFSLPIVTIGFVVWTAFAIVFRPTRKRIRRIVATKPETHHQIPVFENS
jgi:hypothetical protein